MGGKIEVSAVKWGNTTGDRLGGVVRWGLRTHPGSRNPPRSKLRPSRNGRVSGKRFAEFGLFIRAFRKAFRSIDKHFVHFPSTLPFREGRSLLRGGFRSPPLPQSKDAMSHNQQLLLAFLHAALAAATYIPAAMLTIMALSSALRRQQKGVWPPPPTQKDRTNF